MARDLADTTAADRLAGATALWAKDGPAPLIVGLCGAQGSGKSTVAERAEERLRSEGIDAVVLSLDDFYLRPGDRARLARDVHSLFATRGPPGTHDVELALQTIEALRSGAPVDIPRFDKLADDRRPEAEWRRVERRPDVVIFEGWCVGAAPQPPEALDKPVNDLERREDAERIWRGAVNDALAGPYAPLFAQALDRLVLLKSPSFEVVLRWRLQQERANAEAADGAARARAMDEAQVARFIQHYERLTRWMLIDVASRADLVIALDEERRVVGEGPA